MVVPTLDDPSGPATKVRAVAQALGVPERGQELAARTQGQIDAAMALAAEQPLTPTALALYLRGENVQLVLGEGSAVDWILDAAGTKDLGEELGGGSSTPLETEALVVAAPDVLVVTEGGLESVGGMEGLLQIPGLDRTPAAQDGRILAYDDQLLLGNGPRTGELLKRLVHDVHDLPSPTASE